MTESNKTKNKLADVLIELLKTTSFEKITVTDIIHHSGFSRMTFYLYFHDKYDLMNWIYSKQADRLLDKYFEIKSWKQMFLEFLTLFKENQHYFTKVCGYYGQNSLEEAMISRSIVYFEKQLKKQLGVDELPESYRFAIKHYSIGNTVMIMEWINSGMKESPQKLTALLIENIPVPISAFILKDS